MSESDLVWTHIFLLLLTAAPVCAYTEPAHPTTGWANFLYPCSRFPTCELDTWLQTWARTLGHHRSFREGCWSSGWSDSWVTRQHDNSQVGSIIRKMKKVLRKLSQKKKGSEIVCGTWAVPEGPCVRTPTEKLFDIQWTKCVNIPYICCWISFALKYFEFLRAFWSLSSTFTASRDNRVTCLDVDPVEVLKV